METFECRECGKTLPVEEKSSSGRICVPCWNNSQQIHYYSRIISTRMISDMIKEEILCQCCEEDDIDVIDYHHIGEKKENIGQLVLSGHIWRFLDELEKCILVCCKCHKKIHYAERKFPWNKLKVEVNT